MAPGPAKVNNSSKALVSNSFLFLLVRHLLLVAMHLLLVASMSPHGRSCQSQQANRRNSQDFGCDRRCSAGNDRVVDKDVRFQAAQESQRARKLQLQAHIETPQRTGLGDTILDVTIPLHRQLRRIFSNKRRSFLDCSFLCVFPGILDGTTPYYNLECVSLIMFLLFSSDLSSCLFH